MRIQFWWHFASFLSRQPLMNKFLSPRKATVLLGTMLTKTKISQVCFWINTEMSLLLPSVGCANLNLSLFPPIDSLSCIYGGTSPSWCQSFCLFSRFFESRPESSKRHWTIAISDSELMQRGSSVFIISGKKLSLTRGRAIFALLLLNK